LALLLNLREEHHALHEAACNGDRGVGAAGVERLSTPCEQIELAFLVPIGPLKLRANKRRLGGTCSLEAASTTPTAEIMHRTASAENAPSAP